MRVNAPTGEIPSLKVGGKRFRVLALPPMCCLFFSAQPEQAINDQLVLDSIVKRVGQSLVGTVEFVLIVHVVVAHVDV